MILKKLEPAANDDGEIFPLYAGQSLANVPHTIAKLLGVKPYGIPISDELFGGRIDTKGIKNIVLLLFDGLGYNMWLDAKQSGLIKNISNRGIVLPITSIFPSTTAAAITTINTGLSPAEHGLPEWILYMKELGMLIETLPFAAITKKGKRSLSKSDTNPNILYKGKTIYQAFARHGIESFTLSNRSIINSIYTKLMKSGSTSIPFVGVSDSAIRLRQLLEKGGTHRKYVHLYLENIDAVSHSYGPFSEESRAEIKSVSDAFYYNLVEKANKKMADETLVIITADHGHTKVDTKMVHFIDDDKKLKGFLANGQKGKILPTGSPRNVFLHIKEGQLDSAYEYLSGKFADTARVMLSSEAVDMGLFGNSKPSRRLLDRIGNMIIFPNDGKALFYPYSNDRKLEYVGLHGGLSRNEMLIPLGMARLSSLK